ncbi:MAG: ribosome small subunit-dependent GTPase A [Candidatus Tectomicrobia bacterium]|nr:ribosome small subunit-dependent GTPase A [Candidatus Tectomicrobia bacterium]
MGKNRLSKKTLKALEKAQIARKEIESHEAISVLEEQDERALKRQGWRSGVVIEIYGEKCRVDLQDEIFWCTLRGILKKGESEQKNLVAVGDDVLCTIIDETKGVIEKILPRRTRLSRPAAQDRSRRTQEPRPEQIIAANIDQVVIVTSMKNPPLRLGLIDRYLVAVQKQGLEPIICVNKIDLAENEEELQDLKALYSRAGYKTLFTSVSKQIGIEELTEQLKDRKSVVVGHSGVGKSSLIMAVQPNLKLRAREISEDTSRGRHTTTTAAILKLDIGGYVVDTPGIREFGLWNVTHEEVGAYFPEIVPYLEECAMSQCSHIHEPDCAVQRALEQGEIDSRRYESYVRIYQSLL